MKNKSFLIITLITIALIAGLLFAFFRTPAKATAPIQSIPIATNTPAETPTTQTTANNTVTASSPPTVPATRTQIFEISQEDSLASFEIDEVLRGSPFTAIGLTNQIAGQIAFDPNDLSDAQIGTISINARTFLTDNEFRNRALNNRILLTGIYEFIEFVPTALNGLPDSVAIGETVEFEIVGQLTLLDTTKEETFAATVMFDSAETISGIATTTILRSNYDLQIPAVRAVASVEDEVTLTLEFVANAQ